jgi:hypothetical protein
MNEEIPKTAPKFYLRLDSNMDCPGFRLLSAITVVANTTARREVELKEKGVQGTVSPLSGSIASASEPFRHQIPEWQCIS